MNLLDTIRLWDIKHPQEKFFDAIPLHEIVNKQWLADYLIQEYGAMWTVESDSELFHCRVVNFFRVHKWNIDKLAESLEFDYNPIWNHDKFKNEVWARDESIATDIYEDEDWTEKGHTDEQDVNLVSAYNDTPATLNNLADTEHHRDVIEIDYSKEGTDDKTTDKDQVEDEDYTGDIHEWGHDATDTYQELIEQERKQAQFNIYKWIGKHFCLEMLVAIW